MLSKLLAFTSLLASVATAASDCQPCSDDESPWMIQNYKKCAGSYQVKKTDKCYDDKWNFCQESCSLERAVHPENGVPCCGPSPGPAPTPKPKLPSPKQPECKDDKVPFWLQLKPQWVTGYDSKGHDSKSGGGSYEIDADFKIIDLCAKDSGHSHRVLHGKGLELESGDVWHSSSQGNKIALPYCVPETKIAVCFCYVTGPYWITSGLGEADGDPNGSKESHCKELDDYVCSEPVGECPSYY